MKINDDKDRIVIDTNMAAAGITNDQNYYETEFTAKLPPKEGRYAVYDLAYKTDDGRPQNKLVFITWAPDEAPIKEKMMYASSKVT